MEEESLKQRLLEESRCLNYAFAEEQIRERYKDTALLLFKKQHIYIKGSFLSFGSRRSSLVSSYGNTPTIMRRSLSSNGAFAISIEQLSSKKSAYRDLPATMFEEKESEIQIGDCSKLELEPVDDNRYLGDGNGGILCITENHITPNSESEHVDDCKNRKSFLHYDMPLTSKKNSFNTTEKLSKDCVSVNSMSLTNKNMNQPLYPNVKKLNDQNRESDELHAIKVPIKHEEMDEIIDSLRKSIHALSELENSLSKDSSKPTLPDIKNLNKNAINPKISKSLSIPPIGEFNKCNMSESPITSSNIAKSFASYEANDELSKSDLNFMEKPETSYFHGSNYMECENSFDSPKQGIDRKNALLHLPPLNLIRHGQKNANSSNQMLLNSSDNSCNTSSSLPIMHNREINFSNKNRPFSNNESVIVPFVCQESNPLCLDPISAYGVSLSNQKISSSKLEKFSGSFSTNNAAGNQEPVSDLKLELLQKPHASSLLCITDVMKSIHYNVGSTSLNDENCDVVSTNTSRLCILM